VKQGVLLLAHGAPERVEDVASYLSFVRAGRPASPRVLEEVRSRYREIGGCSPLLRWTRAQAEALQNLLGIPVFFGMRNWHPFIRETMEQIRESGVEQIAAVCLAPQFSGLSVGAYIRVTEEAARSAGVSAEFCWARSYHVEPLLIEAFTERLRPLLDGRKVLFTAHSLPEMILKADDPYDTETRATAAAVAARAGLNGYEFAYQSQGFTDDQWLGPTVESCIDRYAAEGVREIVLDPIGFVCDHVEILYDIDILFTRYAAGRGITLVRPDSLNGSPTFTAALAEVAKRCL
jgi:protoporphyrin/coproporphyrin ferrochelatase